MPSRRIVAKELATLLKLIGHPDRIAIIEALFLHRQNVKSLAESLGISPTRLSQHLGVLRSFGLIESESEGREQFYRLLQPELAKWVVQGVDFVANRVGGVSGNEIQRARELWGLDIGARDRDAVS